MQMRRLERVSPRRSAHSLAPGERNRWTLLVKPAANRLIQRAGGEAPFRLSVGFQKSRPLDLAPGRSARKPRLEVVGEPPGEMERRALGREASDLHRDPL